MSGFGGFGGGFGGGLSFYALTDAAETPLETTKKKVRLDEHCEGAGWRDFARPEARVGAIQGGAETRTFEFTEF